MLEFWLEGLKEKCGVTNISEIPREAIKKEIDEVNGVISNERLWKNGAFGEEVSLHEENIANHVEYLGVLEGLLSSAEKEVG